MLWDEPKIFFLERRYFFSIILSEFLKNRVALQWAKNMLMAHIMREIPHFAPSNRLFFYCSIFNNRCGGIFPNFAVFARMGG